MRSRGIVAVTLLMVCLVPRVGSAAEPKFLLYDPDTNHGDIVAITAAFNKFLAGIEEGTTFQAVQKPEAFVSLAKDEQSKFAIVSSAYLSAKDVKLTPLLIPSLHGDIYYRKVLLSSTQMASSKDLRSKNVAVTGAGNPTLAKRTQDELNDAGVTGAMLINVPKDVDALLALYFGQVDAALVAPASIEVLKRVNPSAVTSLKVLLETKKILRSPLCVISDRADSQEAQKMLTAFKGIAGTPQGRDLMRHMAIDSWVPYQSWMANQ
jgi:hypothetical protein